MSAKRKRRAFMIVLFVVGIAFAATAIGLTLYNNDVLIENEIFHLDNLQTKVFDFESDPLPTENYVLSITNTNSEQHYYLVIYDISDEFEAYNIFQYSKTVKYYGSIKTIGFICYGEFIDITFTLKAVDRIDRALIFGPLGGAYLFIWIIALVNLRVIKKQEENINPEL